jgi:hypothetical protein
MQRPPNRRECREQEASEAQGEGMDFILGGRRSQRVQTGERWRDGSQRAMVTEEPRETTVRWEPEDQHGGGAWMWWGQVTRR